MLNLGTQMAHISASNYREQTRVFPVACAFQAKAVPSCSLLCLLLYSCPEAKMSAYPQALAAPQTCPWESCKYPIFQSIILFPFFPPCLIELPGSAKPEEQTLHDEWFGTGVGQGIWYVSGQSRKGSYLQQTIFSSSVHSKLDNRPPLTRKM